jgi:hypothetical protein
VPENSVTHRFKFKSSLSGDRVRLSWKISLVQLASLLNPAIERIDAGTEIAPLHCGDIEFENLVVQSSEGSLGELCGRGNANV